MYARAEQGAEEGEKVESPGPARAGLTRTVLFENER